MSDSPIIHSIKRVNGVAGQFGYVVKVEYPDEPIATLEFIGSAFGGPIVMVTPSGIQSFVSDPGRFGKFSPEWVRKFFGPRDA